MKAAVFQNRPSASEEVAVDAMMIALTLAATMFVNLRRPSPPTAG